MTNWTEIFAVITGLLYIILEIKQKPVMWIVGFFTSLTFVVVFFQTKIYAQMGLNIYYTIISIYGFFQWQYTRKQNKVIEKPFSPPTRITKKQTCIFSSIALILFIALSYILKETTDSETPCFDAFVGSLGIVGTFMLSKKIVEQWYVWIVVNISSVVLFSMNHLYLTSLLYIVYTILSIYGFFKWRQDSTL